MREDMFAALKPDLEKIDFWRTHCFPPETVYNSKPIEEILEEWAEKKSKLFDMFGQQLIISCPVNFNLSMNDMKKTLNNIFHMGNIGYVFQRELGQVLEEFYHLPCSFDDWMISSLSLSEDDKRILGIVADGFNTEVLLTNSYEVLFSSYDKKYPEKNPWLKNYKLYNPKTGHTIVISESMKPMKLFNKLAKEFEIESFEDFRLEHSRILNTKKASGNLFLSIHPLDYMTMSDNNSGWSSCMSWEDHGDYCMGTVEMMNSDCVVIAYLTGSSPFYLDWEGEDIEWNNKRWRCLFIINDTLLAKVKSYPYQYLEAENCVLDLLSSLRPGYYDTLAYEYKKAIGYSQGCYIPEIDSFVHIDFSTDFMYKDFGHNSKSIIRFSKKYLEELFESAPEDAVRNLSFSYSGKPQCMNCGHMYPEEIAPYRTICNSCCGAVRCCDCGESIDVSSAFMDDNNNLYCEDCYYNRFITDDLTGDDIEFDDSIKVHFITKEFEKFLVSKELLNKTTNRIYFDIEDGELLFLPWVRTDKYCLNVRIKDEFETDVKFYVGEYGEKFYYCYVEDIEETIRSHWFNGHVYFKTLNEIDYQKYLENSFTPWWIRNKTYLMRRINS